MLFSPYCGEWSLAKLNKTTHQLRLSAVLLLGTAAAQVASVGACVSPSVFARGHWESAAMWQTLASGCGAVSKQRPLLARSITAF